MANIIGLAEPVARIAGFFANLRKTAEQLTGSNVVAAPPTQLRGIAAMLKAIHAREDVAAAHVKALREMPHCDRSNYLR
jgi:hypothetical protein